MGLNHENLTADLLALLKLIKEHGGTDCTGSCHHRKPGEFHCHVIGQMLKISSTGTRKRIMRLVDMGLLERKKIIRENTYPLTKFTVTASGEKVLSR